VTRLRLDEFLDDEATGRRSTTKLIRLGGAGALIAGFLKVVWVAPPTEALAWLFGVVGGILVVPELLKEWIRLKWSNGNGKANGNGNGHTNGGGPSTGTP